MKSNDFLEIQETNEFSYIIVNGDLTEKNHLPLLKQFKPILVINLAKVNIINSIGIRDWKDWINMQNGKLYLVGCSASFMNQASIIKGFIGPAKVLSCYLPYFCPQCDHETKVFFETKQALKIKPFKPPSTECERCGSMMKLDANEESFFRYLSSIKLTKEDMKVYATIPFHP